MVKTPDKIIEEGLNIKPMRTYKLTYDSTSQTLEPIYFWILDFMNGMFGGGVEKLVDNFTSSPGSGHFSELMGKGTRMQEEAMKIYGMVNTVIKSVINLVYDLKEFQIRLKNYEDAKSPNKDVAMSGSLSLKQIWMDTVDIKRGRGSINMLAQDLSFVTLRDAFMAVETLEGADNVDLNERVKRILKARIQEFIEWKSRSEAELKKRFEIEKTYLRTQVATVKTYSRWAKPYLIAAEQLRMKGDTKGMPEMVNVFNTLYLELSILGKNKFNEQAIRTLAAQQKLPEAFKNIKLKKDYYATVLVDFKFRGVPQKAGQHYVFGGRADVTFRCYSMSQEELDLMKYKLEKSDFEDSLKLVEGMTDETLGQLQADIDEFLETKTKEDINKERAKEQDVNPFMAILGLGNKSKKKKQKGDGKEIVEKKEKERLEALEEKGTSKDNYAEGVIRKYVGNESEESCYAVYDIYKKAHGMPSTAEKV